MPLLHIALQEGFTGEPVAITVDGREIYRKDQVRTRPQIGHADTIETTHDAGPARIEIRARGTSSTITESMTGDLYLAVSIDGDGRIAHHASPQPFRYM